jgi:peroxiredoxin
MLGRFATRASRLHTNRFTTAFLSTMAPTSMPSVEIFSATFPDPKKINIADYCAGKKVILVGLPGAFTPT